MQVTMVFIFKQLSGVPFNREPWFIMKQKYEETEREKLLVIFV